MPAIPPVVAILGARQCGKTTFAKQLAPGWTYFDLEKPEHWEKRVGAAKYSANTGGLHIENKSSGATLLHLIKNARFLYKHS